MDDPIDRLNRGMLPFVLIGEFQELTDASHPDASRPATVSAGASTT